MDSSFFLTTIAAAIGCLTLFRKLRSHQEKDYSSFGIPQRKGFFFFFFITFIFFVSFNSSSTFFFFSHLDTSCHVRRGFLSHIQMEFQRKGITPFIDNEIKRGESIGPELVRAIRGSKIAIILVSRNYASSKRCLDELVEIMKSREELGQTVMAIFYKVDPSDVKKADWRFWESLQKNLCRQNKGRHYEMETSFGKSGYNRWLSFRQLVSPRKMKVM